jgi:hypothetical protein
LELKSGITIAERAAASLRDSVGNVCRGKSRNIITDVRTKANFSDTAIDSSYFRSASSFASTALRKRGPSYFLVLGASPPNDKLLPHEKFIRIEPGVIQTDGVSSNREYSRAQGIFRSSPLSFIAALLATCVQSFIFLSRRRIIGMCFIYFTVKFALIVNALA